MPELLGLGRANPQSSTFLACVTVPDRKPVERIMSLVIYSDSEDDDDQANEDRPPPQSIGSRPTTNKRKRVEDETSSQLTARRPPPLPATFSTLYATNVRSSTNDDPSLHGGRQRQIPHTPGIWPSFIYLEWLPSGRDLNTLESLVEKVADPHNNEQSTESTPSEIHSSLRSELGVRLPLHVSLSAPLALSIENKDVFEKILICAIQDTNLTSFNVNLSSPRWVSNFDGTRQFLIVTLAEPAGNELQILLRTCNRVARSFGLPQLYSKHNGKVGVAGESSFVDSDPEVRQSANLDNMFHFSIAWCLKCPQNGLHKDESLSSEIKEIEVKFDGLLLKVGNHLSHIPLK